MFTTVESRTTISWAIATTTRTSQRRSTGAGWSWTADDMGSIPLRVERTARIATGVRGNDCPVNAAGDGGPNAAISSHDRHTGNAPSTRVGPPAPAACGGALRSGTPENQDHSG